VHALAGFDARQELGIIASCAERIADRLTAAPVHRISTAIRAQSMTLQRGFNRLTPQTLKAVNDLVVKLRSRSAWRTAPSWRVDTTVGRDRHSSSDRQHLLWDVVRVVTRLIGRLAEALELRRIKDFRDRRARPTVACTRFSA